MPRVNRLPRWRCCLACRFDWDNSAWQRTDGECAARVREERAVGGVGPATPGWVMRLRRLVEPALVAVTVAALAAGGIAWLAGWRAVADWCWIAGTVTAVVPAVVWVLAALRHGRVGVDLIAVLSLVGTLARRRVPRGCVDRGDAGRWACPGSGGRPARLPRLARFTGAGATVRAPARRFRGERDPAG